MIFPLKLFQNEIYILDFSLPLYSLLFKYFLFLVHFLFEFPLYFFEFLSRPLYLMNEALLPLLNLLFKLRDFQLISHLLFLTFTQDLLRFVVGQFLLLFDFDKL
jgi:hypothetical protein